MPKKNLPKLDAHDMHKGRDGNNAIDQEAVFKTAEGLIALGRSGGAKVVHMETTQIATDGAKRRGRVVLEVEIPD